MTKISMETFIILMAVSVVGMLLLFPIFSGWHRLAKLYRTHQPPPPNFSRMESGLVGLISFKGTLNVGISSEGLYLSVFPLFSFGQPPLLIPWRDISQIEPANFLFLERYRLSVGPENVKIILRKEILQPARQFLTGRGFEL